jgi:hypothetical protein
MNIPESSAMMRCMVSALAAGLLAPAALAEGFDQDQPGAHPQGWLCGATGRGAPVWAVKADANAPSPPLVLLQSGSSAFSWCVRQSALLADGFVETRFKPVDGREDQAGGVVWRWKDADHYYVARANALENNVSLYYVERGRRHTLKYTDAPVPRGQWSHLRVEFSGTRIRVLLNGQNRIDFSDAHIAGAGRVGVWTKADSITAFDDFSFGALKVMP